MKKMTAEEMRNELRLIEIRRSFLDFLYKLADIGRPLSPSSADDAWVKERLKEILDL